MNPFAFFLALLPIGLVTGWAVGAGLSFTGGRRHVDLIAGLSGAILAALPLHLFGPPGYRETLPALIVGISAAMFATWSTQILTWKPEPLLRVAGDAPTSSREELTHDVMTSAEGTALLRSGGTLSVPEGTATEITRGAHSEPRGIAGGAHTAAEPTARSREEMQMAVARV